MAHMEISRELARQFLERMVDEGHFVKVRGLVSSDMYVLYVAANSLMLSPR